MLHDEMRINVWKDMAWGNNIRLAISCRTDEASKANMIEAARFTFERHHISCSLPPESILPVTIECAQGLMDDLWKCEVRPTEGAGTAGAMAAAQKHLADMRAIVSKKLSIVLP